MRNAIPILTCVTALFALGPRVGEAQDAGPVPAGGVEPADSDAMFPLWKSLLGERKFLPPYGLNIVLFDLSGQWDVQNFSAAVGDEELVALSGSARVHPFTYGARADLWLLPFMNVFVTVGGLKLDVDVTGFDLPLGIGGIPPEVIRGDVNFNLDFTGYYGGGGIVLMYGWRDFFLSGDWSSVWTHLESSTEGVTGNALRTDTASFRFGYNAGAVQPYLGARWVKKIDHFEGTVDGPGGQPLTFAVDLKAPAWNYGVGLHSLVARRYELVVEAGFGERTHGLVNLGYRF